MEDEKVMSAFIPKNFQSGVNLLGKSYPILSLAEGGVLFVLFGGGSFVILNKFNLDTATIVGISISLGLPLGIIGVMGINDEPLHIFIKNVIKYFKNKRTVYYNPKVKRKAHPATEPTEQELQAELLPRDKLLKKYEQFKATMDEKNRKKMLENEENASSEETDTMYFEDDEDITSEVEKPKKDKKTLKKEKKQQRKAEKVAKELKKKEEKFNAKK